MNKRGKDTVKAMECAARFLADEADQCRRWANTCVERDKAHFLAVADENARAIRCLKRTIGHIQKTGGVL